MVKLSIAMLAALAVSTASALPHLPAQDAQQIDQLRQVQQVYAPDFTKLDYGIFAKDLTPEQRQALDSAVGGSGGSGTAIMDMKQQDASPEAIQDRIEGLFSHAPGRASIDSANLEDLKDFASFAAVTYCSDPASLQARSCGPKCTDRRLATGRIDTILQGPSTFGFVAVRDQAKQIVVVYRGSHNLQNWIDNLEFALTRWPYPKPSNAKDPWVHKGFTDTYNEMRGQVQAAVRRLVAQYPSYQVVVTGHSLGGAVATMTVADLVGSGLVPANKLRLAAFHAPRAGNSQFASMIDSLGLARVDRFTQENDIVPHLPPEAFGYLHTQGEKYSYSGTLYVCNGNEDGACADSRVPFLNPFQHANFLGTSWFFGQFAGNGCQATV